MTDKNKTPYTLDEMQAVDTLTARYMGGYNNGLSHALTLATKYEELRRENEELRQDFERSLYAQIEMQAKLEKALDALRFYEHSWVNQSYGSDDGKPSRILLNDKGQRARTTLEEIKE